MSRGTIQFQAVYKRYERVLAVDNLSFSVKPGELLVLLGPSGCGKTSTLRLMAGLESPDAGGIWLDGVPVAGDGAAFVPPEGRRVGMVFQDYALFPHMTVEDNVAFPLTHLPRGDRRARVGQMLDLVGLGDVGGRYPHQLSGGQQQRVALARALAPDPAVVLLDEPFSNLDAALRREMRAELRRILHQAGTTAVFVTHDQGEALSLADRIAVLFDGQLAQLDTPHHVYRCPKTRQVAAFIGESNFVPAQADGETAECALGEVRLTQAMHGPVDLLLRPESLRVGLAHDAEGAWTEVVWRDYLGHAQMLGLRLDDGTMLTARVAADLTADLGDRVRVGVGTGSVVGFAR